MNRVGVVIAVVALTGCRSMDPAYTAPVPPVPSRWPAGDAYRAESRQLPAFSHRDLFRDPRLQRLIADALANNRDLRIAAANIAAARAQVRVTRGAQLPQLDTSASVEANPRRDGDGDINGVRFSPAINVLPSFEIDLFGRLASLTRAQQERLFATEAAARATRIALIGDIADAWLNYAADSSLLSIAENTVRAAKRSEALTAARLRGGIAARTDLLQAQQVLETARGDLAQQRALRAQDINLLQLLVGSPVDPSLLPRSIDEAAPTVVSLTAGLDSQVLLRRPDVVESEYLLRAANAEVGAARAALFPRISLTGLLGFASDTLTGLFSGGAFNFSAGPGLSYSIFSGGAGRATVAVREAERQAALASYEKAIQTAFREVSDALADKGTLADRVAASERNLKAANDTLFLVTARYRNGLDGFLAVLDAQRSAYSAERSRVAIKLANARNATALYRALGGDSDPAS